MTKRIIDHIPILTALIIIVGIIKLTLYYQNFSVPIKYFIDFSEIATTIADDLLMLLLFYGVLKTIEIVLMDMKPGIARPLNSDKANLLYSILLVVINIGLLIWGFIETKYYLKIINSALTYFFLFLTLLRTKFAKEFFEKNREFAFILFYFILILFNIVMTTSREIKTVMNGKYKGTKIVTSDTTYVSTDTSYYIGQTGKYLFIYHSSKYCTVLPTSSIKQLEMHISDK